MYKKNNIPSYLKQREDKTHWPHEATVGLWPPQKLILYVFPRARIPEWGTGLDFGYRLSDAIRFLGSRLQVNIVIIVVVNHLRPGINTALFCFMYLSILMPHDCHTISLHTAAVLAKGSCITLYPMTSSTSQNFAVSEVAGFDYGAVVLFEGPEMEPRAEYSALPVIVEKAGCSSLPRCSQCTCNCLISIHKQF